MVAATFDTTGRHSRLPVEGGSLAVGSRPPAAEVRQSCSF